MSRPIPKGDLLGALLHKFEFEYRRRGSGKHEAVTLRVDGKKVATTRFSRGARTADIGPSILRQIATQLRLEPGSLPMLYGMVDCTVSRDDYLAELRDGGFLE